MKNNNQTSIGKKIMLGYVVIILMTGILTLLMSMGALSVALRRTSRQELVKQGEAIAIIIKNQREGVSDVIERRVLLNNLNSIERVTDADIYILNQQGRILYQSSEELSIDDLKQMGTSRDFIYSRTLLKNKEGNPIGQLILVNDNADNMIIRKTTQRVIMITLSVSALIGLILAYVLQRSITTPIKKLTYEVGHIDDVSKAQLPELNSNDEAGELYRVFNKMIERLKAGDLERKRFFQNSSHELKTPLMSIQGYAEGIKDGVIEGEEVTEALDIIINKSKHLKKTVEDIIYLSRLDSSDTLYQMEELDGADVIGAWCHYYQKAMTTQKIKISYENLLSNPIKVMMDGDSILKVMEILLDNAVRHCRSKIAVTTSIKEDSWFVIAIKDDGDGIKPQDLERIFERFYTSAGGKSGLGLSIAQAIIDAHHGRIIASNLQDGGACFEIWLHFKS